MHLALVQTLPIFKPSVQVWEMVASIVSNSQLPTFLGAHAKDLFEYQFLMTRMDMSVDTH
jgi:hypothetical protein